MLVLTRKLGEGIHVGKNVEVVVLRLHGSQVRLGIAAPDSVSVLRGELVVPDTKKGAADRPRLGDVTN